jgi:hypothetical protein
MFSFARRTHQPKTNSGMPMNAITISKQQSPSVT